jgi:hypothetical protein
MLFLSFPPCKIKVFIEMTQIFWKSSKNIEKQFMAKIIGKKQPVQDCSGPEVEPQIATLNGLGSAPSLLTSVRAFPPTPDLNNKVYNTVVDKYAFIAELMQSRQVLCDKILNGIGQLRQYLITQTTKMVSFSVPINILKTM